MDKYEMRRGFLLLVASLALAIGATTLAQADTHPNDPVPFVTTNGTRFDDRMHGGRGRDIQYGLAGADRIWTGTSGEFGTDSGRYVEYAYGGRGHDRLNSWSEGQGPAYIDGGAGYDICKLSPNDHAVNCEVVTYKDGGDRDVVS